MRRLLGALQQTGYEPVTRSRLAGALRALGVREGGLLMVHVRMSALGWIAGGIDAVVWALLDAIGRDGTLIAFTGWDDSPFNVASWPAPWRRAYRDQPGFDPAVSAARHDFGRFPERLRTWPGAVRTGHPEVSFAAVGPLSGSVLVAGEADDPWGADGPLGRLVAVGGQVLMLGAPLSRLTLCHHAEAVADIGGKRHHEYEAPIASADGVVWRSYRTLDTFFGTQAYWEHPEFSEVDSWVGTMAEQVVLAGATERSELDECPLVLVEAREATEALTRWLETVFR